ncbi:MAG: hypothetical protein DRH37_11365 [Deltaproteobacteria bacterium]|nr:MAG: hypothetical protein DRH37_11365 [Deltaproteobacteria bacterium]
MGAPHEQVKVSHLSALFFVNEMGPVLRAVVAAVAVPPATALAIAPSCAACVFAKLCCEPIEGTVNAFPQRGH